MKKEVERRRAEQAWLDEERWLQDAQAVVRQELDSSLAWAQFLADSLGDGWTAYWNHDASRAMLRNSDREEMGVDDALKIVVERFGDETTDAASSSSTG